MTELNDDAEMSFWDHLDVLRGSLIRMIVAAVSFSILGFIFKKQLFDIVLAPSRADFITYRLMGAKPYNVELINTQLTEQFLIHMKMALMMGVLCASPYILYLLYKFITPALYENEKRHSVLLVSSAYIMFIIGMLMNYFLIYPITLRFLTTYNVSSTVHSMLSLNSYADTMIMMCIIFGAVFEIPVVSAILAKLGILHSSIMTRFRKQAIVVILVVAAIITPTSDVFTLLIVSIPIYILYEASIIIVKVEEKKTKEREDLEDDEENDEDESENEESDYQVSEVDEKEQ
jgi:sec-independent protein translocase protein TatC